jgi:hypothetical protein
MDLRRELHLMIDHLLGDDPRNALTALHRLERELPWLHRRAVSVARLEGWSDERIQRHLPAERNRPGAEAPGLSYNSS